ncbi:tropomyosin alpha-3 chain-like [Mytilus californianus]|uniref:tropomyosin alpha-3 chain-like n=1 Tax=Mytilus californianus TaxID=6549 RepID=UPI0022458B9C|nr:tropomyosin alpha-3 chain-like [Mytilus californianus]XP_052103361.1 tropomyosin alpha-3 chain-like [Mytilus californianus]XP_052103362.1 tropomyosin alpha-3 chain-like [Mytilus californianus]
MATQEKVESMENYFIEEMRGLNKRAVNYILTESVKKQENIQSQVVQVKSQITKQLIEYKEEVSERLEQAGKREEMTVQLHAEIAFWKERANTLDANNRKIFESDQDMRSENAKLERELKVTRTNYERSIDKLKSAEEKIEELSTIKKENFTSIEVMKKDLHYKFNEIRRLQAVQQEFTKEQLISVSVGDICRAISSLQDTFRSRIKKATASLVEIFQEETSKFEKTERAQYEQFIQQSTEKFTKELDLIRKDAASDILSEQTKYEAMLQSMREQHELDIKTKIDNHSRDIKVLMEHHSSNMTKKSERIRELVEEKRTLTETIQRFESELNLAKKQTMKIIVRLSDIEDVDEVRFHLDLYRKCITILENLDGKGDITITAKEIEVLWRKVMEWQEEDIPDSIKEVLDEFTEKLSIHRSHLHFEDNNDKTFQKSEKTEGETLI